MFERKNCDNFIKIQQQIYRLGTEKKVLKRNRGPNMPFKKKVFCQTHSVNLRTENRVLFFEETCFFGIIPCTIKQVFYLVKNFFKSP